MRPLVWAGTSPVESLLETLQFVRRPAALGLTAAFWLLAAIPQRPPRSPFDNPEIRAPTRTSGWPERRQVTEDTRRFEVRLQELVRAWNSFAAEYTERGTFNIKKARDVNRAWHKLESEAAWPKK